MIIIEITRPTSTYICTFAYMEQVRQIATPWRSDCNTSHELVQGLILVNSRHIIAVIPPVRNNNTFIEPE